MKIEDDPGGEAAAEPTAGDDSSKEDEQKEKVIVRSDGTVTYVGKDMAYQLWKFGLLGKDFHYRIFEDGQPPLWSTTSQPDASAPNPPFFGRAAWVCNVIDTRQSYLQKLLKQALAALGYHEQAAHSIHYSYEMVALSHQTARELGYDTSEGADRPFVEVSGRKGLGVKADDLLDRLRDKAAVEVAKRNPELPEADAKQIAEAIATAAVRYFMVKFSRGKIIIFDIDEALSFEGESGPYLQYAAVRANNIFHKLKDRHGIDEAGVIAAIGSTSASVLGSGGRGGERPLEPGPRGGTTRRGRGPVGTDPRALRPGEVRLRAGPDVQRLLPQVLDPQRGARGRPALARRRGGLLPPSAHPRARADGMHRTGEDVMKPIIGISRCSRLDDYVASIEQAGGRPRVLEVSESAGKVLGEIHGLLLTGGGDVDPVFYGEDRHPATEDAEPGRDEFEMDLARRAVDSGVPLLAICRGAQVLNVATGGTLVQDIPTRRPDRTAAHAQRAEGRHGARRDGGARLQAAQDPRRRRHQFAHLPCEQPSPSIGWKAGQGSRGLGHRCRWRDRSDRGAGGRVLRRRSVAPGELLENRRVPRPLRRVRRYRSKTPSVST